MRRVDLKIVPDDDPDADGCWIAADIPHDCDPFKLIPIDAHHVVAIRRSDDPRDGGPMHKMSDPVASTPHVFNMGWLK